jgi:hypothetical protein
MTREHLGERALYLAALEPRDPERLVAEAHARGCVECARALRDGQRLLVALDAALPPEPAASSLARTAHAVHAAQRAGRRLGAAKAASAAVLAGIALAVAARHRAPDPDFALFAGCLLAAGLLAAISIHRPWLALAGVAALAAGASWRGDPGAAFSVGIGLKCASFELVGAAAAVLALLAHRRRHPMALAPIELAALAGAGSLAGVAALVVTCPAGHALEHLMLFHSGGVALALVVGVVAQVLVVKRSSDVANV